MYPKSLDILAIKSCTPIYTHEGHDNKTKKIRISIFSTVQTRKELRQGNPFSPILFSIVVDILAIWINYEKEDGQVEGSIRSFVQGGASILQYVDDNITFMVDYMEKSQNMKLMLCIFEQLCGINKIIRVNFLFWPS